MRFPLINQFIALYFCLTSCWSCENKPAQIPLIDLEGKTMGTNYHISYRDSLGRNFQSSIDSLLLIYNKELSTYIPDSRISLFNSSDSGILIPTDAPNYFLRNLELSQEVYRLSEGWFNPTVMPLVKYFNFGPDRRPLQNIDSVRVDSLRRLCHFEAVSIKKTEEGIKVQKDIPGLQLDFSAVAKGDAVDELGIFLQDKGIEHYMVEIGGEIRTRGYQNKDYGWIIGINTPKEGANLKDIQAVVEMKDRSLATSGNYRNFYELNGVKYAHTINPFSGYPEAGTLLSASIFATDCSRADAFATAAMAMGFDKAWAMVQTIPDLEGYFIFSDEKGLFQVKYTDGLNDFLR